MWTIRAKVDMSDGGCSGDDKADKLTGVMCVWIGSADSFKLHNSQFLNRSPYIARDRDYQVSKQSLSGMGLFVKD